MHTRSRRLAAFLCLLSALGVQGCFRDQVTDPLPGRDGPKEASQAAAPRTRTYYVGVDAVRWDYAPSGYNQITGQPFDDEANVFVANGRDRIGRVYYKALYREYTDAGFTSLKPTPPEWQHLGALGPAIRGQVGDTIKVVFRNNTPDLTVTFHPHGVFYNKDSEGAPYDDGTNDNEKMDDGLAPGATHTYVLPVPERAGPGPGDGSSIVWMYHSHKDEIRDTNAGLVGPIIITAPGRIRDDGRPIDVDREFALTFTVVDENESWYLERNIQAFAGTPSSVRRESEDFAESNLMHAINGYVFGNLPLEALSMKRGERVRWYLLGIGTEVDIHTPHWHGQTGLWAGMRTDIVELLPASMKVFDMIPDNPGTWLLHCHVNDHIRAGMLVRFRVD